MGFKLKKAFKKPGRILAGIGTMGASEWFRNDPFGSRSLGDLRPILAGTAVGTMFGQPMAGAQVGAGIWGMNQSQMGQREMNEMNIAFAKQQEEFQERMSSTAHQRAVADMKAAGINPILAAGAGASSPGGAAPDIQNENAQLAQILEAMSGNVQDNLRYKNELRLNREQVRNARLQGDMDELELEYARKNPELFFGAKEGALDTLGLKLYQAIRGHKNSLLDLMSSEPGHKTWWQNKARGYGYMTDAEMRRRGRSIVEQKQKSKPSYNRYRGR